MARAPSNKNGRPRPGCTIAPRIAPAWARCHLVGIGPACGPGWLSPSGRGGGPRASDRSGRREGRERRFRNWCLKSLASVLSPHTEFSLHPHQASPPNGSRYGGGATESSSRRRACGWLSAEGIAGARWRRGYALLLLASPSSLCLGGTWMCRTVRGMLPRVRMARTAPIYGQCSTSLPLMRLSLFSGSTPPTVVGIYGTEV